MNTNDIRKYLDALNNAISAAKINAYLLRRIHGEALSNKTIDGLNSGLYDAERLVSEFHRSIDTELADAESLPPQNVSMPTA